MHKIEITHCLEQLDTQILENLLQSSAPIIGQYKAEGSAEFKKFTLLMDSQSANEQKLSISVYRRKYESNHPVETWLGYVLAAILQLPHTKDEFKNSVENKLRATNYTITIHSTNVDDGYLDLVSALIGNGFGSFQIRNVIGLINDTGYWSMYYGFEKCYDSDGIGDQFPIPCETNDIDLSQSFNQNEFDAIERKLNSYRTLGKHSLRSNPILPLWIYENDVTLRRVEEVWERIWALWCVLLITEGVSNELVLNYTEKHGIGHVLSPQELQYIKFPDPETGTNMSWRWESFIVLYWSLGIIDEIPFPPIEYDLKRIADMLPFTLDQNPFQFILQYRTLRSTKEILEQSDLYYRANWIARDSSIRPKTFTNFIPSVAYERFYALNWLVGLDNSPWDEKQTPS